MALILYDLQEQTMGKLLRTTTMEPWWEFKGSEIEKCIYCGAYISEGYENINGECVCKNCGVIK